MTASFRALLPLVAATAMTSTPAVGQTEAAVPVFESGVILSASTLLEADILQGPSYRFRDQVATDGYMAHFTLDTDFGVFTAVGVPQAKQRISEITAIRKLVDTSKSDLFAEGLKRSIETPIDAVKNIADDPVNSLKKAPKTVGHFFGKVTTSIGRGLESAANRAQADEPAPSAGEVGNGIGDSAKKIAGFEKAKLDTAKQLGVDPYSDNPRLQEEMDKVTWAFFAGGLPLRLGAMAASAGFAVSATNMVGVPEDTYALTESELINRDHLSLVKMEVPEAELKAFLANPAMTTTRRHQIVASLENLVGVNGREQIIRLANSAATAGHANFLVAALKLIESRHRSGASKYTGVTVTGRLPAFTTDAGEFHVPAPVDYVTWTEGVAGFATRGDLGNGPKALIHTGTISQNAAAGFASAGWALIPVTSK